jgi:hypothetical protein
VAGYLGVYLWRGGHGPTGAGVAPPPRRRACGSCTRGTGAAPEASCRRKVCWHPAPAAAQNFRSNDALCATTGGATTPGIAPPFASFHPSAALAVLQAQNDCCSRRLRSSRPWLHHGLLAHSCSPRADAATPLAVRLLPDPMARSGQLHQPQTAIEVSYKGNGLSTTVEPSSDSPDPRRVPCRLHGRGQARDRGNAAVGPAAQWRLWR